MSVFQRARASRRGRTPAVLSSAIAAVAVLATILTTAIPASAAPAALLAVPGGPATVTTSVSFVSGQDLTTPIAQLKANEAAPVAERRFALQVGYGCGSAAPCESTTIKIDPQPLDTFYGTQRFATYDSSTLPAGASIAGTPAAGYTITLGTLTAGATGTFTVLYSWQTRLGNTASAQSFFLDGTTITNRVTIDAANAGATSSAEDSITWRIDTKAPLVAIGTNGVARAGIDYSYDLRMGSDCMWYYATGNYGEPAKLCAASYSNRFTLPAGAVFVSASPDGAYDAATGTVTWAASGYAAATGWGSHNGRGQDRTVVVRFPDSLFTSACAIDVSSAFETTVTYLDGQTKTASTTTTNRATNCVPFASATPVTKTSALHGQPNLVWDNGAESTYTIRVGNKANVPGVAVIRDENLDVPNVRVFRVTATDATIDYVLDNGATGTAIGAYQAPAGRRLASVVVTSPEIAGPNEQQASQPLTNYYTVALRYATEGTAPADGWERSNTATATMTYPNTGLADVDEGSATASIVIARRPATFGAAVSGTVPGGGNPVAGQPVNYTVRANTSDVPAGTAIEPQYVFVAPAGWALVPGSWSVAAGAPAGVTYETRAVTIGGQARQALVAHWPAGVSWGANATWANLTVQATPASAAAGSSGIASAYIGDATHSFPGITAIWSPSKFTDAPDLDGDGAATEFFAAANAAAITVGASAGLGTLKEICQPDPDAADGCDWISDTTAAVGVSPVSNDLRYRVTLRNNGNSALSGVVAYDVLPYPGDTGVSASSAATPRGSDFAQSVTAVSDVSAALQLTYSDSTDPCRSEVYPGGPAGCVNAWDGSPAGAVAIRAAVSGTLAPGASASFVYTASVLGSPSAGDRSCNSIATAATGVPVSEPSPVCAEILAADLAVTAAALPTVQLGRPAALPFEVRNVSGTTSDGTVTLDIPAGIEVRELEFGTWSCTAGGESAPIDGPVELTCAPSEPLEAGELAQLDLPVVVHASGTTVATRVDGPLYDPEPANNADAVSVDAEPGIGTGLIASKDDGIPAFVLGQETTYTIVVENPLLAEAIGEVTVVDELPVGVEFVGASDGGVHDAGAGTVTWTLTGMDGAERQNLTVTTRVTAGEGTAITNEVTATAEDPAFPGEILTGAGADTNHLDRISLTKTGELSDDADPTDPRVGDTVEYLFVIANTGGGRLTDVSLSDAMAGLSDIEFEDGWPRTGGELAAGASVTATATYTLTAEDIDAGEVSNTAVVTAASGGAEELSESGTADVLLPAAGGLALEKTAALPADAVVRDGDLIEYAFTISNTGNVTAREVVILDEMEGLSEIEYAWPDALRPGVIPAGGEATATATYALTQADIDRGTVDNSAIVSGTDAADASLEASAEAQAVIAAVPGLIFEKTGEWTSETELPRAGDVVTFAFTLENSGNVGIASWSIVDHLDGVTAIELDADPTAPLAPGARVTGVATYVLSQADVDAGEVVNTATAAAVPVRGASVEEEAEASVPLEQRAELVLDKRGVLVDDNGDDAANAGEGIRYSFVLRNDGNVTLTDVSVDDPKVTGLGAVGSLAPGQTVEVFADVYEVTLIEALEGRVDNVATAAASGPGSAVVASEESSVTIAAAAPDEGALAVTGWLWDARPLLGGVAAVIVGGMLLLVAARRRRSHPMG